MTIVFTIRRPNQSLEPLTAVGAGRLRSQRRHAMGAPQMTFAARTVVTVAGKSRGHALLRGSRRESAVAGMCSKVIQPAARREQSAPRSRR